MNNLNDPYMTNNDHAINRTNCNSHEEEENNIYVDKQNICASKCVAQNNNITSRKRYINYNNISGAYNNAHNNFYNQYKKKPKKNYNNKKIFCENQQNGLYHIDVLNNINFSNNKYVMNKIKKPFERNKEKKSCSYGLYKDVNDCTTYILDNKIYEDNNLYLKNDILPDYEQNKNDTNYRNKKYIRDCQYICSNNELSQNSHNNHSSLLSCEDIVIKKSVKKGSYNTNENNDGIDCFENGINERYNNLDINYREQNEENNDEIIEREEYLKKKNIRKYHDEQVNKKKRNINILSKNEILKDAIEYFQNCSSRNNDNNIYCDSSNEEEINIKTLYYKENICFVCKEKEYIYKCPYCEIPTCSLECSKNHKKIFKCIQKLKKNLKIKNISKDNFDESILYKDFLYLQNIETIIQGNYKYIKIKDYETTKIWLLHNKKFNKLFKKRKIILLKAPIFTKIHNENKTFISNHIIFWSIKITFININIKILYHQINENLTFLQLIQFLCSKIDKLQTKIFIYLQNVKSIYISLKNEQTNNNNNNNNNNNSNNNSNNNNKSDVNKYCSVQQVLRKSLCGKTFYEYPHFYMELFYEHDKPITNPLYDLEKKKQQDNQHTYKQHEDKCKPTDKEDNTIDMDEGDNDDNDGGDNNNDGCDNDNNGGDNDNNGGDNDNDNDEGDNNNVEGDNDNDEDDDYNDEDDDYNDEDDDYNDEGDDYNDEGDDYNDLGEDDMNNNDYNNM
ncbi:conserved Plasmodium protein, unknown function [Plasmodium gaboni]|uniref:HIT-type domain-containing protein n=1 Tax=Plasmodium gaboni TaxID=647221 RepID=A0ABY1UKT7_9APIC|nr:conserved Plasmodium protein, unknown function [Plasmodium gaboni]